MSTNQHRSTRFPSAPPENVPVYLRGTSRIEAFSDGVFAIAITLLILDIRVPQLRDDHSAVGLWRALRDLWPSYLSFMVSFVVIGIIWVNHHNLFKYIKQSNHVLLLLNIVLLCVSIIPFPTTLLADYIAVPGQANVAMLVYSGTMLVMGLCYSTIWRYVKHTPALLNNAINEWVVWPMGGRNQFGIPIYFLAFVLAIWSVAASLLFIVLGAVWYALPSPEETPLPPGLPPAPSEVGRPNR